MTNQPDWIKEREAIRARVEAADEVIRALNHGERKWRLSVPAQPDSDPDLVISAALCDVSTLLSHADQDAVTIATLEALTESLGHPVDSPCGHSSIYAVSNDGGAHIRCLLCRELKLTAELALREQRISELWDRAINTVVELAELIKRFEAARQSREDEGI